MCKHHKDTGLRIMIARFSFDLFSVLETSAGHEISPVNLHNTPNRYLSKHLSKNKSECHTSPRPVGGK